MNDRELISKLVTFLLGENWHSCCIDSENINLDIYETVCRRYRGVKEDPVDRWRRKHKRCYFCKHCRSIAMSTPFSPDVFECNAKGKTVNIDIPKPFCGLFELNIKKEK